MIFIAPYTGGATYIPCAQNYRILQCLYMIGLSNYHPTYVSPQNPYGHFRRGQNRPSRRENIRAERTARRKHMPPRPSWSHKNKKIVVRNKLFSYFIACRL